MRRRLAWWIGGSTLVKFCYSAAPGDDGSFWGPYSAFFASRLGKKVSRRFKGSASLRIYCRSPAQPAFHKVGVSSYPTGVVLIICSSRSALNVISKSVMIYLHENDMSCKALAIDLCCRGFSI